MLRRFTVERDEAELVHDSLRCVEPVAALDCFGCGGEDTGAAGAALIRRCIV